MLFDFAVREIYAPSLFNGEAGRVVNAVMWAWVIEALYEQGALSDN